MSKGKILRLTFALAVYIRAVGVKERNRVRIGKEVIDL